MKLRRCAKRSAVRWLSWPKVPGVSQRRQKQDELLRGLEGLVFSSARRPARIARCRPTRVNVLRHAVERYGGHTEVHVMTTVRIRWGINKTPHAGVASTIDVPICWAGFPTIPTDYLQAWWEARS